jgi:hypothetical protein
MTPCENDKKNCELASSFGSFGTFGSEFGGSDVGLLEKSVIFDACSEFGEA